MSGCGCAGTPPPTMNGGAKKTGKSKPKPKPKPKVTKKGKGKK